MFWPCVYWLYRKSLTEAYYVLFGIWDPKLPVKNKFLLDFAILSLGILWM